MAIIRVFQILIYYYFVRWYILFAVLGSDHQILNSATSLYCWNIEWNIDIWVENIDIWVENIDIWLENIDIWVENKAGLIIS